MYSVFWQGKTRCWGIVYILKNVQHNIINIVVILKYVYTGVLSVIMWEKLRFLLCVVFFKAPGARFDLKKWYWKDKSINRFLIKTVWHINTVSAPVRSSSPKLFISSLRELLFRVSYRSETCDPIVCWIRRVRGILS